MMLEVHDLHAYYGQSHILHGVDLSVDEGEIVSLLGRNGVGRSTTCKAIMGLVAPQGVVRYRGRDIAGLRVPFIWDLSPPWMSVPESLSSSVVPSK